MNCHQCFGSNNDPNKCPVECCELRFIETGSYRKKKMTREEAIKLVMNNLYEPTTDTIGGPKTKPRAADIVAGLEALGLLKFDEPDNTKHKIFEIKGNKTACGSVDLEALAREYGVIRLEYWPEGLVLWVGGQIVWKSWEKYYNKGDAVTIDYYDNRYDPSKRQQAGIIK